MSKAKDNQPSKDFSPRLLLQNFDGRQTAVPLNDSLRMVAGVETWPLKMVGDIRRAQDALRKDTGNTTIFVPGGGGGPFVVTLGIKNIFQRVANARAKGEFLVDLVAQSGCAALEAKAQKTSVKSVNKTLPTGPATENTPRVILSRYPGRFPPGNPQ